MQMATRPYHIESSATDDDQRRDPGTRALTLAVEESCLTIDTAMIIEIDGRRVRSARACLDDRARGEEIDALDARLPAQDKA
jgi:hypothetical protein